MNPKNSPNIPTNEAILKVTNIETPIKKEGTIYPMFPIAYA